MHPFPAACSPFLRSRLDFGVIVGVVSLMVLASLTAAAHAAAVEVPGAANPGQVQKRFEPEPTPPSQLDLNIPAPVESQQIPEKLRQQLEKNKFVLKSVEIEGATAYKPDDLASIYQDKVGQTISLLDAKDIANALTQKYHRDGYILSQAVVPAQSVEGGVLKIRVVEGYIGDVSFEGEERSQGEKRVLTAYAEQIKALHPATIAALERYILLMNDLPGATVHGLIRPSAAGVGSADLVLTVTHKEFDASLQYDNRGNKYLGPWEESASVDANSLFGLYDHTQIRLITADPFKELFDGQIEHDELLDDEGTRLGFGYAHTRTQPGDILKQDGVIGYSDNYEARVTHPFLRLRQQTLVGRVLFDVNNTTTNLNINSAQFVDRLRSMRVGGDYNFLDTLQGSNTVDVQLSQGMNIFNATSTGDRRSNAFGDSAYTKTNFDLSRLQRLPGNFSLLMSATGQYSFDPLLTVEQFSLGGSDYGRAFDPSELLGDSGLAGKAELRYGETLDKPYLNAYQLYTYYDVGQVWVRDAGTGVTNDPSLSSFGIGARVNITDYVSSSLEGSVPVTAPSPDQTSYRGSPRVFFTLAAHY